jgi:hypothetical protein
MRDYEYVGSTNQPDAPIVDAFETAPSDIAEFATPINKGNKRFTGIGKALLGFGGVASLALGLTLGAAVINPSLSQLGSTGAVSSASSSSGAGIGSGSAATTAHSISFGGGDSEGSDD